MPVALQTDEYRISISREIQVCKNMISRQEKALGRFEQRYGLATERMLAGETWHDAANDEVLTAWRTEYQGLLAWRERLREYEEAVAALRR